MRDELLRAIPGGIGCAIALFVFLVLILAFVPGPM